MDFLMLERIQSWMTIQGDSEKFLAQTCSWLNSKTITLYKKRTKYRNSSSFFKLTMADIQRFRNNLENWEIIKNSSKTQKRKKISLIWTRNDVQIKEIFFL